MMIKFTLLLITAAYALATPLQDDKNVGDNCVITQFEQVESVVKNKECTNIVVDNLSVPSGEELQLHLKNHTTLTFKGTISFGYEKQWEGPMIRIQGNYLTVSGAGATLDGQGAHYWDGKGGKGTTKPKFLRIQAKFSTVTDMHLLNCPKQCTSILNSEDVTVDGWNIDVSAGDQGLLGHNTDGFDISRSSNIIVRNCVVKNQDDCVVVDSGSDMIVDNVVCSGGHGLSLSVGVSTTASFKNEVSNITFSNSVVKDSRNGIHIKTHTNGAPGHIKDITYRNIEFQDLTNYGVNVQEDYRSGHSTGTPSGNIPIVGLTLTNVTGTMKGPESKSVYVLCGDKGCDNFNWSGVSITGAQNGSYCNYQPDGFSCKNTTILL